MVSKQQQVQRTDRGASTPTIISVGAITLVVGLVAALALRQTVFQDDAGSGDAVVSVESFELGPNDIIMEPANGIGIESFSVEPLADPVPPEYTAPLGITPASTAPTPTVVSSSGAIVVTATPAPATGVAGRTPGLYGGTRDDTKCDALAMVAFLMDPANLDKAEAWVKAQNADPRIVQQFGRDMVVADLPGYIGALTPMILQADTRTTNHGFKNGTSNQKQAVLQKGTAVLVDKEGVVRARCLCGNPQIPPKPVPETPVYVKPPPPAVPETPGFPFEDEYDVPFEPVGAVPPEEPITVTEWPGTPDLEASPPGDPTGPTEPIPPLIVIFCDDPAGCVFDPATYGLTPPPYGADVPPPSDTPDTTVAPETTVAPDTTVAPETTAAPETTVAPTTTEFVGTPPTLTLVKFETQPIENGLGCGEGNRLVEVELAYTDPDGDVFQGLYVNGQGDPKASNLYEFVGDESSGTFTFTECSASGLPLTYEVLDRAGNLSNVVEGLVE